MAKAMPNQLKQEIRKVLRQLVTPQSGTEQLTRHFNEQVTNEAIEYLMDLGALMILFPDSDYVRVTAYGREYYEKLTTFAPWHWFKQNWFAAMVAAATIAASVGGIVVSALD